MKRKDKILLIDMGGTIGAETYNKTPRNITPMDGRIVEYELAGMGLSQNVDYLPYRSKDSKDFTDEEIRNMAEIIKKYDGRNVVITLGTDAMPQIAKKLRKYLAGTNKIVTLTGAMEPLAASTRSPEPTLEFSTEDSDGRPNLAFTMDKLSRHEFSNGVHVVMRDEKGQPREFDPRYVKKNFEGKFYYDTREQYRHKTTGRAGREV